MKALSIVAAFLGGVTLGAAAGILFAPERGEDTRRKIAEVLRKKGIRLNRAEMEDLVDQIGELAFLKGINGNKYLAIKNHYKDMDLNGDIF